MESCREKLNKMKMILSVYSLYSNGAPFPHLATIFREDQKAFKHSRVHPRGLSREMGQLQAAVLNRALGQGAATTCSPHPAVTGRSAGDSEIGLLPFLGPCSVPPHTAALIAPSQLCEITRQKCASLLATTLLPLSSVYLPIARG